MISRRQPIPHLFLDRDGTLIKECHYLSNPEKVVIEAGVVAGLLAFSEAGYRLVVVSNQSGIARNMISEAELGAINRRLEDLLAKNGIVIDGWHHCPHHPDQGCTCRKPGTAMIEAAHEETPVDWQSSFVAGDKDVDVNLALACGMTGVLLRSGHGRAYEAWAREKGYIVVDTLEDLASIILNNATNREKEVE